LGGGKGWANFEKNGLGVFFGPKMKSREYGVFLKRYLEFEVTKGDNFGGLENE